VLFGRQKGISKAGDRQLAALDARRPPSVHVVGLYLLLFPGFLPAVAVDPFQLAIDAACPSAEVANLAANLLLPCSAGVGR
jgi:hypothetical protein